jgi:arsenate reductase
MPGGGVFDLERRNAGTKLRGPVPAFLRIRLKLDLFDHFVSGKEAVRMSALKIYTYANCDTCRKAVKWLRAHDLAFDERPIRETPPTAAELRTMLAAHRGERRRLFNTSGKDYREQKLGEKLPAMSEAAALGLLAGNGNLVKRPFLLGARVALTGFDEPAWSVALLKR